MLNKVLSFLGFGDKVENQEPKKTLFEFNNNELSPSDAYHKLIKISDKEFKENFTKYSYLLNILAKDDCGELILEFIKKSGFKFKVLENKLLKNTKMAFKYLKLMPGSTDAEASISSDFHMSFNYATEILRSRFLKGEEVIFKNSDYCKRLLYCTSVNYRNLDFENDLFGNDFANKFNDLKFYHPDKPKKENDFVYTVSIPEISDIILFFSNIFLYGGKFFLAADMTKDNFLAIDMTKDKFDNFNKIINKHINFSIAFNKLFCPVGGSIGRIIDLEEKIKKDIKSYIKSYNDNDFTKKTFELCDFSPRSVFSYISSLSDIQSFEEGYEFVINYIDKEKSLSLNMFLAEIIQAHSIFKIKSSKLEDKILELVDKNLINSNSAINRASEYMSVHVKERFPKLERLFRDTPNGLLSYASHLGCRIPEMESEILNKVSDSQFASLKSSFVSIIFEYFKKFVKTEWKPLEEIIFDNAHYALDYALITNKRFVIAEKYIFQSSNLDCIKNYINLLINFSGGKIKRILACEKAFIQRRGRAYDVDYGFLEKYITAVGTRCKTIEDKLIRNLKSRLIGRGALAAAAEADLMLQNYGKYVFFGERWEELEYAWPEIVDNDLYKGILNNGTAKPKRQRRKSDRTDSPQKS